MQSLHSREEMRIKWFEIERKSSIDFRVELKKEESKNNYSEILTSSSC